MLSSLVAVIPYTTHPTIELGPLTLRTFGLMTAIGVVLGIWFAAAHGEKYGMTRDDTYRLGTRMVLAGVVGARATWVATHWDQIQDPIDVIAVWEGGLQFSGGFIAAIAVGLPTFLGWSRLQRWQLLDGFAVAVLLGAAFGRLGCLAVGEHFGRESDFLLATRYDGGELREPRLGLSDSAPFIEEGTSFLNPSLYECITLFVLFGILWWILAKKPTPSTVGGIFLLTYAVQRFTYDAMRVNDERVAGMTGAQWMCLAMVPIGIYLLVKVRPALARAIADGEVGGTPVVETTTRTAGDGTTVATTKRRASSARPAHTTSAPEPGTVAVDDAPDAADGDASDAGDAAPSGDADVGPGTSPEDPEPDVDTPRSP
ncbi:prolipoprotein diacylglyceryl transferase [Iamia sp. SCSIO 61187]|uniref:prolipoprotein diacylglyceryl transferase n=1 Tax=Iamia sp. SCSIO 61187 TaxID=2722752 RepID=UPI001C6360EF|nr:prolipoprotein diacylglyceryl transferase [Iamia sp. SCSIO 61187]QYG94827.1 prolipoprotein diacylglyceryl transferase [Iamia sp. SCSIO 61187]